MRSYIGLVNFIGKFIPNFSTRIAPISSMLSKEAMFVWGEAQEEAFQSVLGEIRSYTEYCNIFIQRKKLV